MPFTRRNLMTAMLAAPLAPAWSQERTSDGFVPLEARASALQLRPEPAAKTAVWGFNAGVPGPLLRISKGEELKLRLANALPQPVALSFHGLRGVSARSSAAEPAPVLPGQSIDMRLTPLDSGLFWYRPGLAEHTAEQKARGLFGMLIVDEPNPPDVDLDLPVIVTDWKLGDDGAIAGPFPDPGAARGEGRIGDFMSVNAGAAPQHVEIRPGARVRLRILNACNARLLAVMFEGLSPLVIAVDGQPCDPFAPSGKTLPLGPGARFDVLCDLPALPGARAALTLRGGGLRTDQDAEADRDLVVFDCAGEAAPQRGAFAGLPPNPLLPTQIHLENARRFDIEIQGPGRDPAHVWALNIGRGNMAPDKPLFSVRRGQPVALGFINKTPVVQSLHVQGHVMRLLHPLDDGWEPYWRDSIIIAPGKTVHTAFVAEGPGKWLIESPIFEHAAAGARSWFEVA